MTIDDRVNDHAARHGLLPPGAGVLALVSGGADSTCLMHLLARLHDGQVQVLVVDHGLRPAAADEAAGVVGAAEGLGLTAHRINLNLEPGPAAMERARDARLAAAEDLRRREGLDVIATGHTRTDHAETVIFRIARGTGRTGGTGTDVSMSRAGMGGSIDAVSCSPSCMTTALRRTFCSCRTLPGHS